MSRDAHDSIEDRSGAASAQRLCGGGNDRKGERSGSGSRRRRALGQKGIRGRRKVVESNVSQGSGEEERFDSAGLRGVIDDRAPTLPISNTDDEEETLEGLNRRLEVCAEEKMT